MKPNYTDLGLSYPMGDKLRKEVEYQLSEDIRHYGISYTVLKYDWSGSCIEGRCAYVLDGHIDEFSDICVFNTIDVLIAEGWMNFIYEKQYDIFEVYWDQLDLYIDEKTVEVKKFGIPDYIFSILPDDLKIKYRK